MMILLRNSRPFLYSLFLKSNMQNLHVFFCEKERKRKKELCLKNSLNHRKGHWCFPSLLLSCFFLHEFTCCLLSIDLDFLLLFFFRSKTDCSSSFQFCFFWGLSSDFFVSLSLPFSHLVSILSSVLFSSSSLF